MTAPPPVPPPGCPAHAGATATEGITRLYGPETIADPGAAYERLRAEYGAVAPILVDGDFPGWLVLGYRENLEVMRTPSRFSRDARNWRDWREGRIPPDATILPIMEYRPDCVSSDGAEHQRLRTVVTESLDRFDRRGIRKHVQRLSHELIDRIAADGHADLVAQYAQQLPMLVIAQLYGLPDEMGARLVEASAELMMQGERALECNEFILQTLRDLADRKRAEPAADFPSWLIEHPNKLSEDEVLHHLRLVMVAANELTIALIANTLRVVLTDDRFAASLAGARLTLPDAVEQVLWDEPPLWVIPGRWALVDTELGGRRIKAGDLLVLGVMAGNVDPQIRTDLTVPVHNNRAHLAFSGGAHLCPGQDIGRAITDTAIDTLNSRLPDIRLAHPDRPPAWHAATWARYLTSLPVEFTPVPLVEPTEWTRPLRPPRPTTPPAPPLDPLPTNWWTRLTTWLFG
ncbi:cytochrome P450 [Embleya sp. NPDC050493]|uniref:cytochrome P450 n=1 Tax=Embleya sp. NPDC050493 TaxID=3363989 RepID=UPI0037B68371